MKNLLNAANVASIFSKIQVNGGLTDLSWVVNLSAHLPGLLGLTLDSLYCRIESWDFLSAFEYLEQLSLSGNNEQEGLINAICNINNGLKYLHECSIQRQELECLAKSKHAQTLLQLDLSHNNIGNNSDTAGLVILCQNLTNDKVLILEFCLLNFNVSPNTISSLIRTLIECEPLECLSMRYSSFSNEILILIVDSLAQKQTPKYLGLDLPIVTSDGPGRRFTDELDGSDLEDRELFKNKINKFMYVESFY